MRHSLLPSFVAVTFALLKLTCLNNANAVDASLSLRYREPATEWVAALPVGNGRLGAMIFGGVTNEHLQLNEATLWSGGPRDWNNPGAKVVLPKVRAAVFAGNYAEADRLYHQMQGPYNNRSAICCSTFPLALRPRIVPA